MMMGPGAFISKFKDSSYEELLIERDRLLKDIKEYEDHQSTPVGFVMDPSPDVRYQCNLLYLSEICKLIHDKYIKEKNTNN